MKKPKHGRSKRVKKWNLTKVSTILDLLKIVLALADIIVKLLK